MTRHVEPGDAVYQMFIESSWLSAMKQFDVNVYPFAFKFECCPLAEKNTANPSRYGDQESIIIRYQKNISKKYFAFTLRERAIESLCLAGKKEEKRKKKKGKDTYPT